MRRISTATKQVDKFGAGKHGFTDGNELTATPATDFEGAWCDAVQEEIASFIESRGITLNPSLNNQLTAAILDVAIGSQKAVVTNSATFEASVSNSEGVRWDSGNSRFDEAVADGTSNNRIVGFADVTNSKVYLAGECPLFSGLTPGARYYLDATTPGAITTTAPGDAVSVGIAKSATVLWIDIDTANYAQLGVSNVFTKTQAMASATLTYGATVNWDASTIQLAKLTLAGNPTIAAPTGQVANAGYAMRLKQDATGGRVPAWSSVFKFPSGIAPPIPTDANSVTFLTFVSDGTNMECTGMQFDDR